MPCRLVYNIYQILLLSIVHQLSLDIKAHDFNLGEKILFSSEFAPEPKRLATPGLTPKL
jgi:hypothetical protein